MSNRTEEIVMLFVIILCIGLSSVDQIQVIPPSPEEPKIEFLVPVVPEAIAPDECPITPYIPGASKTNGCMQRLNLVV